MHRQFFVETNKKEVKLYDEYPMRLHYAWNGTCIEFKFRRKGSARLRFSD